MARLVALPDQRRRLKPIHAGHPNVQQNGRKLVGEDVTQGLGSGVGLDQILTQLFQNGFECDQVLGLVIY